MKIITVCGSAKNKNLIRSICRLLKGEFIVLEPPLYNIDSYENSIDDEGMQLIWKGATYAHLNRIKTADVCVMANPHGYLGVGSSMELGYAVASGKLVIAIQHDAELARESLFDIVLETEKSDEVAKKITKLLKG